MRAEPTTSRSIGDRRGRTRSADRRGRARRAWTAGELPPTVAISDDSLVNAKQDLADAVEALVDVLRSTELRGSIAPTDRANLAKYLTIAKLRLENAIAVVRSDDAATDRSVVTGPPRPDGQEPDAHGLDLPGPLALGAVARDRR